MADEKENEKLNNDSVENIEVESSQDESSEEQAVKKSAVSKLISSIFGVSNPITAIAAKVQAVTTVTTLSAIIAVIASIVIGIVAVVSGVFSSMSGVLDTQQEQPLVLVRSAATGNSNYEGSSSNLTAKRREMARRVWSVMSGFQTVDSGETTSAPLDGGSSPSTVNVKKSYGLRPEQICAMLGNWQVESNLDPTSVETVFDEPFMIGNTKQQASMFDFITDYGWSSDADYFKDHPAIFKSGIGLAQWTDTAPIVTVGGTKKRASDWKFNIASPGRNTRLITYAKLYGMKYYVNTDGHSKGWNKETWISGDTNTEGYWYDPRIQLAFALDKSDVGDKGYADWLWDWAGLGEDFFSGDLEINLNQLADKKLEGWTATFNHNTGWSIAGKLKDNVVNLVDSSSSDISISSGRHNAVGDETRDVSHFKGADNHIVSRSSRDAYYNTSDDTYNNEIQYDAWTIQRSGSTSWSEWNRTNKVPVSTIVGYNNVHYTHTADDTAREIAMKYAEKSADAMWHGRLNDSSRTDTGYNYVSSAAGNDFIADNNPNSYNMSDYQEWRQYATASDGSPVYGWVSKGNPAKHANELARKQYISCFKYFYRYHLYRYLTLYYTTQFMHEYEGSSAAIEKRQENAAKWFQMWWDTSNRNDRVAEPNEHAKDEKQPTGVYDIGYEDYFFKTEQGYAQGIMQGIARTKDNLEAYEKHMKIYNYDADMKDGKRVKKIDTDEIAQAACLIAYPTIAQSAGNDGTDCYKYVHDMIFGVNAESPNDGPLNGGAVDHIYQSCDRTACTAIRWSGVDDNFPGGNTLVQAEYLASSPRWTEIDWGGDEKNLQPGDVLIRKDSLMPGAAFESSGDAHHIAIYCGNTWCKALASKFGLWTGDLSTFPDTTCIVHGSYGERSPGMGPIYEKLRSYHAYRCTDPMATGKSIYNSISY